MKAFLLILLFCFCFNNGYGQKQNKQTEKAARDSIALTEQQASLIVPVRRNLLTTQIGLFAGAGDVSKGDKSALSYAGNIKGIYYMTGALYTGIGIGFTHLRSYDRADYDAGRPDTLHTASLISTPIGIGFAMGDDRAQIVTGIDFLPSFYLNANPEAANQRDFALGFAPEFGFTIRIGKRYHLGMQGTVQFFQPYDRSTDIPRYTFVGVGAIFQYD